MLIFLTNVCLKISLNHVCNPQYQLFYEHVKHFFNVSQTKQKLTKENFTLAFGTEKSKSPRFWKVIKTEPTPKQPQFNVIIFTEFGELNSDCGTVLPLYMYVITGLEKVIVQLRILCVYQTKETGTTTTHRS